eukprot:6482390-Amphidinium_carterae.1
MKLPVQKHSDSDLSLTTTRRLLDYPECFGPMSLLLEFSCTWGPYEECFQGGQQGIEPLYTMCMGVPVATLLELLGKTRRSVLSTTLDGLNVHVMQSRSPFAPGFACKQVLIAGYEGSGQGFALRVLPKLSARGMRPRSMVVLEKKRHAYARSCMGAWTRLAVTSVLSVGLNSQHESVCVEEHRAGVPIEVGHWLLCREARQQSFALGCFTM